MKKKWIILTTWPRVVIMIIKIMLCFNLPLMVFLHLWENYNMRFISPKKSHFYQTVKFSSEKIAYNLFCCKRWSKWLKKNYSNVFFIFWIILGWCFIAGIMWGSSAFITLYYQSNLAVFASRFLKIILFNKEAYFCAR